MSFQVPGSRSKSAFGVSFRQDQQQGRDDVPSNQRSGRPGTGAPARQGGADGGLGPPDAKRARTWVGGTDGNAMAAASSTSGRDAPALPVERYRTQLLYMVEQHATTIVVGATGCGKTTQLPQYLHQAGWTDSGQQVVCTQPRRVAAVTVATRVAEEMGCQVGCLLFLLGVWLLDSGSFSGGCAIHQCHHMLTRAPI
jgi:HrpA-like RNA helicase